MERNQPSAEKWPVGKMYLRANGSIFQAERAACAEVLWEHECFEGADIEIKITAF